MKLVKKFNKKNLKKQLKREILDKIQEKWKKVKIFYVPDDFKNGQKLTIDLGNNEKAPINYPPETKPGDRLELKLEDFESKGLLVYPNLEDDYCSHVEKSFDLDVIRNSDWIIISKMKNTSTCVIVSAIPKMKLVIFQAIYSKNKTTLLMPLPNFAVMI